MIADVQRPENFRDIFSPEVDESIIGIIEQLMDLNPEKRPFASEILQKPLFEETHFIDLSVSDGDDVINYDSIMWEDNTPLDSVEKVGVKSLDKEV
jgi:hypothetical protein